MLKSIANIFIPLIPAFIGAGLIGGIAAILSNLLTAGSISGQWIQQIVTVLNVIKDGMLFYLAIFTGINSAKVFGATPGLGGVIGGTTLLTGITDENQLKYFHWRTSSCWTRWYYWCYLRSLVIKHG